MDEITLKKKGEWEESEELTKSYRNSMTEAQASCFGGGGDAASEPAPAPAPAAPSLP